MRDMDHHELLALANRIERRNVQMTTTTIQRVYKSEVQMVVKALRLAAELSLKTAEGKQ